MDRPVTDISHEALEQLTKYDYPGNVRELENIIERDIVLATSNEFTVEQLPSNILNKTVKVFRSDNTQMSTLDEREEEYIRWVLEETGWNRTRTAEILGIARASLWRKLKKYGME